MIDCRIFFRTVGNALFHPFRQRVNLLLAELTFGRHLDFTIVLDHFQQEAFERLLFIESSTGIAPFHQTSSAGEIEAALDLLLAPMATQAVRLQEGKDFFFVIFFRFGVLAFRRIHGLEVKYGGKPEKGNR